MNCPKCSTKILSDVKFCPNCGFNLEIDKKLDEIGENPPFSRPPKDTAMCYSPVPIGGGKKRFGCILGIALGLIIVLGLILILSKL